MDDCCFDHLRCPHIVNIHSAVFESGRNDYVTVISVVEAYLADGGSVAFSDTDRLGPVDVPECEDAFSVT